MVGQDNSQDNENEGIREHERAVESVYHFQEIPYELDKARQLTAPKCKMINLMLLNKKYRIIKIKIMIIISILISISISILIIII